MLCALVQCGAVWCSAVCCLFVCWLDGCVGGLTFCFPPSTPPSLCLRASRTPSLTLSPSVLHFSPSTAAWLCLSLLAQRRPSVACEQQIGRGGPLGTALHSADSATLPCAFSQATTDDGDGDGEGDEEEEEEEEDGAEDREDEAERRRRYGPKRKKRAEDGEAVALAPAAEWRRRAGSGSREGTRHTDRRTHEAL